MGKLQCILDQLKVEVPQYLKELYGDEPSVLKKQATDYVELIEGFQARYGHSDGTLFSAPGRTEIGGNHTDHNYGRVLAGAVNLDNIAVAAPNGTMKINIASVGYEPFTVDISSLDVVEAEKFTSVALVRGICARLKELGYAIGGFDASIFGRVPKGSGLSSSASFEVLVGAILSELFNDGRLDAVENALIGQYAENQFFGKPCGLMDQTACSVGGLITIDFEDPASPVVEKVDFDFVQTGYSLVITDTGGNHADLNDEYASLPVEMKQVAAQFGKSVLRQLSLEQLVDGIPSMRGKVSDRAILRAYHFQKDNARVVDQVKALETERFDDFLKMVIDSGQSSFMYNQNIYPSHDVSEQGLSLALALSDMVLKGEGAWRVHGGGFAGTIQAFVPSHLLETYVSVMEHVFGEGACHKLFIRPQGTIKIHV